MALQGRLLVLSQWSDYCQGRSDGQLEVEKLWFANLTPLKIRMSRCLEFDVFPTVSFDRFHLKKSNCEWTTGLDLLIIFRIQGDQLYVRDLGWRVGHSTFRQNWGKLGHSTKKRKWTENTQKRTFKDVKEKYLLPWIRNWYSKHSYSLFSALTRPRMKLKRENEKGILKTAQGAPPGSLCTMDGWGC